MQIQLNVHTTIQLDNGNLELCTLIETNTQAIATIASLIILFAVIVLLKVGIQKEIDSSKRMKQAVDHFEDLRVKHTISKFDTKELGVLNQDGLFIFDMSCRILSFINEDQISFSIKATVDGKSIGFRLFFGRNFHDLEMVDIGKTEKVIPVAILSNGSESDLFLKILLDLWLVEKRGKARMKSEISAYTQLDSFDLKSITEKPTQVIIQFGVDNAAQIEPLIALIIDWQAGSFQIVETDHIMRQLIINRLMV